MSDSAMYVEVCLEHAEDGFRWRISEVDGIYRLEYQEYLDDEGKLETRPGKGEWKTRSEFEGLWCSEVDKICKALKLVAEHAEI